ncbi:penicillin acylase family protein [Streptomyces collinus]|uniref:penicillin acylase family protein n=1 Tax=Streptomyces collinus TaxID=42684 RepID=UPI0036F173B1
MTTETYRDAWGIPHLRAPDVLALAHAQGRVTALDRAWQIEVERHRAQGTSAVFLGAPALSWDVLVRRARLDDTARRCFAGLERRDAETARWVRAYVDGVNEGLADGARRAPEFARTGLAPGSWQPWTPLGVWLATHLLFAGFPAKLWREQAVRHLGPGAVGLFATDGPGTAGSNGWLLSGDRTETGLPLLAGDPHRFIEDPGVYQQIRLSCPEFDVVGLAVPGVPGIAHFGHTGTVAWSVTNAMADYQDLYRERLRRIGAGVQALDPDGTWRRAARHTELVETAGERPLEIEVLETARGPVIAGGPEGLTAEAAPAGQAPRPAGAAGTANAPGAPLAGATDVPGVLPAEVVPVERAPRPAGVTGAVAAPGALPAGTADVPGALSTGATNALGALSADVPGTPSVDAARAPGTPSVEPADVPGAQPRETADAPGAPSAGSADASGAAPEPADASGAAPVPDQHFPTALSLRYPPRVTGDLGFGALLPLLRARRVEDVDAAFDAWAEPVNVVQAADTEGGLLHRVAGRVPVRAAANLVQPVPAWRPGHDWRGWHETPYAGLTDGIAVMANQRGPAAPLGVEFAPPHRADRIRALLTERGTWTAAATAAVHTDTHLASAAPLLDRLAALDGLTPEAARLRDRLLGWDRRMDGDSTDAAVHAAVRTAVVRRLAAHPVFAALAEPPAHPEVLLPWLALVPRVGYALEHLLRAEELYGIDRDAAVRAAVEEVAAAPPAGTWSDGHRLAPWRALPGEPYEEPGLSGDHDCVLCTSAVPGLTDRAARGPAARYVWDLARREDSRWIVPFGADGVPGAPHHRDQLPLWLGGELAPVVTDWAQLTLERTEETDD